MEKVKSLRKLCNDLNKEDCQEDANGRQPYVVVSGRLMKRDVEGILRKNDATFLANTNSTLPINLSTVTSKAGQYSNNYSNKFMDNDEPHVDKKLELNSHKPHPPPYDDTARINSISQANSNVNTLPLIASSSQHIP